MTHHLAGSPHSIRDILLSEPLLDHECAVPLSCQVQESADDPLVNIVQCEALDALGE